ncbi:telomerase-binding protein EST1A isoform X2 [Ischnura elegans]|uniref:telomerase-binding protein EST1A isoform X2 n=1 Tax=Ischnura elegans TaxID=197161 RepID=UPI001ED87FD8|nr:telomerase-binding protein EST1A isoform X2 [Ischnura elegans]
MADNIRGRNGNWINSYQDETMDVRERDEEFENSSGFNRHVKFRQRVYVPGSGPLRKSEESNGGGRRSELSSSESHSVDDSRSNSGKGSFGDCAQPPGGVRKPPMPIYQPPKGKKGHMDSNLENIGRRDYSGFSSGPRSILGDSRESTPSRGDIPLGPPLNTRSLGRHSGRGGRESREQTPSTDVNSHDEGSNYGDTARRKAKKPDQARYIPKGRVSTPLDGRDQANGGDASEIEPSSLDSIARDPSPLPPRRDFGAPKQPGDNREPPRGKRNERGRRRSDSSDHRGDDTSASGRGRCAGDVGVIRHEEHNVARDGEKINHDNHSLHGNCHEESHPRDGRRSKRSSGNRGRNFNMGGDGDGHLGDEISGDRRNRSPQEERRHIPSLVDLRPIPDPLSPPHLMRNGGRDNNFVFGGDLSDYRDRDDDLDDRSSASQGGRVRAKPPSGRRGSGASVGSIGGQPGGGGGGGSGRARPPPAPELPPRLRKKLLGMDGGGGGDAEGQAGGGRRHYDSGGEDWDGSSVTFQWSHSRRRQPPNTSASSGGGLSAARGRGRGRRGREGGEGRVGSELGGVSSSMVPPRYSRSLTPDRLSESKSSTVCRYPADVMAGALGNAGRRTSWRTSPPSPRSVTPSGEHSRYRRRSGSNPWDGMGANDRRNAYVEPIRPKLMELDPQPRSLGPPPKDRPFSPIPVTLAPSSDQHNRDWRSKEPSVPPVAKPTTHIDWTVEPDDADARDREDEDDRTNDVTSDSGMASLPRDKRSGGNGIGVQSRHISDRGAGERPEEGRKSKKRSRRRRKGEGRGDDGDHAHRSLSRDQGRRDQDRDKGRPKSKDRERERERDRERERERVREKERNREREKARAKAREKERERMKERGGRELERNWRDVERRDVDRRDLERREMERRDLERRDLDRKDLDRRDLDRRDVERRDIDRRDVERRDSERRDMDRRDIADGPENADRRDLLERREIVDRREIDRREVVEPGKDKVERGRAERGRNGDKERERPMERERAGSELSEGGSRLREDGWEAGHMQQQPQQRGGILILPPPSTSPTQPTRPQPLHYPVRHPHHMPTRPPMHQDPHVMSDSRIFCPPRVLYDPNDPGHPILVPGGAGRVGGGPIGLHPAMRNAQMAQIPSPMGMINPAGMGFSGDYVGTPMDQHGPDRPSWYDPYSESFRNSPCPRVLMDIERADMELRWILSRGQILERWDQVTVYRHHLQLCLQTLLATDLKFCEAENVESHIWKVAFYNIVEPLRKELSAPVQSPNDPTPSDSSEEGLRERRERAAKHKEFIQKTVLGVIEEWTNYLEDLLTALQTAHKFSLDAWLDPSSGHPPPKGLRYLGLALISAQKILIFLGDLARYKEQTNETANYGKARQWYLKAQLVNPKNGRPYNQLALLAIYARRKLDAVYYYMRSLMASNPFHSARENLLAIFDEIRKKFEQTERKRREEEAAREKERRASRESGDAVDESVEGKNRWGLRREIWIRPDIAGGRRLLLSSHRGDKNKPAEGEEEERELGHLSSVEVNKRFVTSYLHVQGKLFTKVGMETFQEAGLQMLREFRTLLLHSPLPLNSNRLLQLLALNMFAIENTQLRERDSECGSSVSGGAEGVYRSAVQESALVVSLQMFNLLLERCVALLKDLYNSSQFESTPIQPPSPTSSSSAPSDSARGTSLATSTSSVSSSTEPTPDPSPQPTPAIQLLSGNEDIQTLLRAIKVWCDWLLCHSAVWNPPPSCADYSIGPSGDAWSRLAELVSLLGRLQHGCTEILEVPGEGLEAVRLPEDSALAGFTPLMANYQEPGYVPTDSDMEQAQVCLRIQKLLFFGTEFLCGLDPPVLKLHVVGERGESEYVSVVSSCPTSSAPSPTHALSSQNDQDVLESFSEEDEDDEDEGMAAEKRREEGTPVRRKTDWAEVDSDDDEDEIRILLSRREELQKRQMTQEKSRQRTMAILAEQRWAVSGVEVEVRPRFLVPDTNCFIDHLPALRRLISLPSPTSRAPLYSLMVPLIVVSELEGLARGGQRPTHSGSSSVASSASHCVLVAEGARSALALLRSPGGGPVPGVRCVTTRGTVLPSSTFTVEEDDSALGSAGEGELRGNDDRILATCLSLVRSQEGRHEAVADRTSPSSTARGWRRSGVPAAKHIYCEVVLLTEDRNLRVKALARDVPVRGVEWFLAWATGTPRTPSRSSSSKCPSPPSQRGSLPNPGPLAT